MWRKSRFASAYIKCEPNAEIILLKKSGTGSIFEE